MTRDPPPQLLARYDELITDLRQLEWNSNL